MGWCNDSCLVTWQVSKMSLESVSPPLYELSKATLSQLYFVWGCDSSFAFDRMSRLSQSDHSGDPESNVHFVGRRIHSQNILNHYTWKREQIQTKHSQFPTCLGLVTTGNCEYSNLCFSSGRTWYDITINMNLFYIDVLFLFIFMGITLLSWWVWMWMSNWTKIWSWGNVIPEHNIKLLQTNTP